MATAAALIRRLVTTSTPMGASFARITSSAMTTGPSALSRIEASSPTPTPRGYLADAHVGGRPDEASRPRAPSTSPTGLSALSRVKTSSPTPHGYLADAHVAGRPDEVSSPRALTPFNAAVFGGSLTAPSSNAAIFRGGSLTAPSSNAAIFRGGSLTAPSSNAAIFRGGSLTAPSSNAAIFRGGSLTAPSSNAAIFRGPPTSPKVISGTRWRHAWAWTPWDPKKPEAKYTSPPPTPPTPPTVKDIVDLLKKLDLSLEEEVQLKMAFMEKFYKGTEDPMNMKVDLILKGQDVTHQLLREILARADKKPNWGTFVIFGRKVDITSWVSAIISLF